MSDFGLFEASVDADEAPARRERVAADRLSAAVDEVRVKYGPFLLAATGLDEFDDRFAYSRKDIVADVVKHVPTYPNVMRAVHGALKADFKRVATNDEDGDGLPEGADDTESKAKAKRDKKEHKESRHHLAEDRDAPLLDTDETFDPSDDQLIPDGDFDGYLDEVDQGGPEKVESADFGSGGDTGSSRMAAMIYTDWAHTNGMRAASMDTLRRYASTGASQGELTALAALIQRKASEDECDHEDSDHEDDSDSDDDSDDGGDNPFEGSDDSSDDSDDSDSESDSEGDSDSDSEGDSEGDSAPDSEEGGDAPPAPEASEVPVDVVDAVLQLPPGTLEQALAEHGLLDENGEFDDSILQAQEAPASEEFGGGFPGGDEGPAGPPLPADEAFLQQQIAAAFRFAAGPMDPAAGGQPPMDPSAGADPAAGGAVPTPPPLENQPAEDDLLDVANQAVNQMIQRETLEFQQVMDPLNQALQAIEYAQSVEQMENPLDVMPQNPEQDLNVDPSQAPDAQAAQADMAAMGGGGEEQAPPLQQQAARIAQFLGLTRDGYAAVIEAMNTSQYSDVAAGVRSLPPAQRQRVATTLADLFRAGDNYFSSSRFLQATLEDSGSRRPFVSSTTREGGETKGWGQLPVLDSFDYSGAGGQTKIPADGMDVNNLPAMDGQAKSAAGKSHGRGVMDKWDKWTKSRQEKGLNHGGKPAVDQFKTEVGVGDKAVGKLEKNLGLSDGGSTDIEASPAATKAANFFTRRVPGWSWDDHLSGYITTAARDFTCSCGEQHPTPSHNVCKCGKIWNSYVIASGNGEDGRTANVDMYVCREIPVRAGVIMASTHHACSEGCGCAESTEWVEDEDREDADAPHAPGKVAAIGEDDHVVERRDGERYCKNCDALLWDPNVHHCPAKQASVRFADWTVYDDAPDLGGPAEPPSTVMASPPSDWARRGDGGKWVPPMFAR